MKIEIMTGDEAVARGAYEASCHLAAAYPGTPSTEILENISALYADVIDCRWTTNEKTALEVAGGAAIGGMRALAAMKHVGVNVAADPMFTFGMTGSEGGLVIISADDPACHSSQNEQDNRLYAPHAKLAMVEASDSQECKDYIKASFEISEKFDIPVLFRMTTRVCHAKSLVKLEDRQEVAIKPYESKPNKYAMLPAAARVRHAIREKLLIELEEYANTSPLNRTEWGDKKVGIVTSGISYQYARDVFGDNASYLKLGLTHPLPGNLIKSFCQEVETILVIEEGEPYLETKVRTLGFDCTGKDKLPNQGEFSTSLLRRLLTGEADPEIYTTDVKAPPRPPVLCAGCPHRGYYNAMKKRKKDIVAVGDIGCYALGVNEPFNGFDISICMGAGFTVPIGLSKALEKQGDKRKVFGMLGDSTFFHSGMTGLVDVVHSDANVVICILDNDITAMTGHQVNPGTDVALNGQPARVVSIESVVRGAGFTDENLRIVNPISQAEMDAAIDDGIKAKGPFVIITKYPCALIKEVARTYVGKYCVIDQDKCKKCKACLKIACPAIALKDGVIAIVDRDACTACGLCMQVCKFGAISKVGV
ncbi:MAG TPA: indolepyruvate ferredoxin oxidoreductase subunit alpha [Clostridiales bacterium]|nr:indolepyruvate ferredoxin oxidoreductase subunit alpha [Clostridiales bacterium]